MTRAALRSTLGVLGLLTLVVVATLAWRDAGDGSVRATSTTAPAAPSPASSPTAMSSEPAPLLPNLRSLPAGELSVETTGDGVRLLRFSSSLANVGPGPLELVPDDGASCPVEQRHASQRLFVDEDVDGRFDRSRDVTTLTRAAGCMLDHPTHDHWHFDAMARYALTPPGTENPIVAVDKVSFCLRDNATTPGGPLGQARFYPECDGRLSLQGISPGWADIYRSDLPGQVLELPDGTADGLYCLRTTADPDALLVETEEADNGAVQALRLVGTTVIPAGAGEGGSACLMLSPADERLPR